MRLKLSLLLPAGDSIDLLVTTDASATVGEVAARLADSKWVGAWKGAGAATRSYTLQVQRLGQTGFEVLPPDKALSETSLESGSTVALLEIDASQATKCAQRGASAELMVVQGPDLGNRYTVLDSGALIGRGVGVDVPLSDPLVSKRHARLEVERGQLTLVDLNSANGLVVDGLTVPRATLSLGDHVEIGGSRVQVVGLSQSTDDALGPSSKGTNVFTRSPRVEVRFQGERHTLPALPSDEDPQPFPFLIMLAPLIMGVVLFTFTQSLLSVIFIALSPLMIVGSFISGKVARKAKLKRQIARFERKLCELAQRMEETRDTERAIRAQESPSTFEVVQSAERREQLLWNRRPEHWNFLNLNLGVGASWSRTSIVCAPDSERTLPEFEFRAREFADVHKLIDAVPIIESLPLAGGIGVVASVNDGAEYVHGLIAQLTGLHSPCDLALAALVNPGATVEFDWMKWLPHATAAQDMLEAPALAHNSASGQRLLAKLEELIDLRASDASTQRHGQELRALDRASSVYGLAQQLSQNNRIPNNQTPTPPALLVLVVDPAPVDRGRLIQLFERGAAVGVFPIWLTTELSSLPAVCRTYVEIFDHMNDEGQSAVSRGRTGRVSYVRLGEVIESVELQTLSCERATFYARSLSPVIDASRVEPDSSDLPGSVALLELLGRELGSDSSAVVDRWRQTESIRDRRQGAQKRKVQPPTLRALVGQAGLDAMHLDLRAQGPHALVGGTTGSGKSEFLQAWVLGMAAEYSPDRVTFLFVDYKGGTAFADCVRLPHCVGLVTDLSPHLVRRALTSLRAEIQHRERLLNRKKAKDLLELEKRGDPECPPSLVIVIDEFAALSVEIPEFVDGVVDLAQRGRSLGMHLIMATQRPAGVMRENLRANTNLRIALRMADESDSVDVIGQSTAAHIDSSFPGRGIVKSGPGRLLQFQTGNLGGWTTSGQVQSRSVQVSELGFGSGKSWEPTRPELSEPERTGLKDITRLVDTIRESANLAQILEPRRPWLDELASTYDLAELPLRSDHRLPFSVCDDPERQEQYVVSFDPEFEGNIGFFGAGGSGKTTALRTLAIAAALGSSVDPVHVYGVDCGGGGLRMLEELPHVGSIVAGEDHERVRRLFTYLKGVVDNRVDGFAEANAVTSGVHRSSHTSIAAPRILLLVDGMAAFRQQHEFGAETSVFQFFQQLLAEGRRVGVHIALTADRPGSVPPSVMAGLQKRVILRLAEDTDYVALDAPRGVLSTGSPAGRALIDGRENQIAVLGGSAQSHGQAESMKALASSLVVPSGDLPAQVRRLDSSIPLCELKASSAGSLTLGVADDTLESLAISPESGFLVAGPPGSGRTTLMLALAAGITGAVPGAESYYFGLSRSPVALLSMWRCAATTVEAAAELARALIDQATQAADDGRVLVVMIEGVADFLNTGADHELVALVKLLKRTGHFVVGESEASSWSQSWPLLMEFKSGRRGFLLQPEQSEGELLLRTSLPRIARSEFPPGRGYLVESGGARKVQVADPAA